MSQMFNTFPPETAFGKANAVYHAGSKLVHHDILGFR